jgi:hypothetical protein
MPAPGFTIARVAANGSSLSRVTAASSAPMGMFPALPNSVTRTAPPVSRQAECRNRSGWGFASSSPGNTGILNSGNFSLTKCRLRLYNETHPTAQQEIGKLASGLCYDSAGFPRRGNMAMRDRRNLPAGLHDAASCLCGEVVLYARIRLALFVLPERFRCRNSVCPAYVHRSRLHRLAMCAARPGEARNGLTQRVASAVSSSGASSSGSDLGHCDGNGSRRSIYSSACLLL